MARFKKVSITCAECKETFCYKTRSNMLKTYCTDCAKQRIDASKRRSKEKLSMGDDDELSEAELEARLAKIPDREYGWNSIFNLLNKQLV